MREIVFDSETTGIKPEEGHRLIEIAAIELYDTKAGAVWQSLINPERSIPSDASAVHGIKDKDVAGAPLFNDIVDDFLDFVGDSPIVAHNAPFDKSFVNSELARLGIPPLNNWIDTLQLARDKLPGKKKYTLDALCDHYKISRSKRIKHGALIDTELLLKVYVRLTNRISQLDLGVYRESAYRLEWQAGDRGYGELGSVLMILVEPDQPFVVGPREWALPSLLTEAEIMAHEEFLNEISENYAWPLWWKD